MSGGLVVAVQDVAQVDLVKRLASQLDPSPPTAVVVDVSAMTMAPREGVEQLVSRLREVSAECRGHRWSLVAGRLTARRILNQICAGTALGVFPNVDAALAALPGDQGPYTGSAS